MELEIFLSLSENSVSKKRMSEKKKRSAAEFEKRRTAERPKKKAARRDRVWGRYRSILFMKKIALYTGSIFQ